MGILAYPIFAFLLLAVAVALWSYGGTRPRGDVARSGTWLGCSVLGTLAAFVFSIFLAGAAAMSDAPRESGDTTGRAYLFGFSPLLIALLVVAITARGRAGPLPERRRLLKLLLIAAFVVALIAMSYLIVTS
jgi:hypothetical protein